MSIDDTTGSTVPPPDPVGAAPMLDDRIPPPPTAADDALVADEVVRSRRFGWFARTVGVLFVLIAGAVIASTFVPSRWIGEDWYVLAPGTATDTAPAIDIEGADAFPPDSEIAFTTVSIRREVSVWDWAQARWFDDARELVDPEIVDPSGSIEETRQATQFQMDQSQDTATLVALTFLGYELVPEIDGAFVLQLVEGTPAAEQLRLGDLITRVNDTDIRSSEDLSTAIQAQEPGATITVDLLRSPLEQGGSGADPNATAVTLEITLAEHPDPELVGRGFLGVSIQTPVRADAPFDVDIDVGRVRGPSAGLAFALSIVDVLTEGELTGGIDVATTGTIDRFGVVGRVGGVPQKTQAAIDAGIEVFLVPPEEYVEAVDAAGSDLEVRCVQTFTDAIIVLGEFGGNGVAVAEAAGAPTPELSPNPIDPADGVLTCAEATAEG